MISKKFSELTSEMRALIHGVKGLLRPSRSPEVQLLSTSWRTSISGTSNTPKPMECLNSERRSAIIIKTTIKQKLTLKTL
jgi:hypothetical protein